MITLVYCDILDYIDGLSLSNCSHVSNAYSSALSGYYILPSPNGSHITVYYDMECSNCDGNVGWMRVGYVNMTEPNTTCSLGLKIKQYNNIGYSIYG